MPKSQLEVLIDKATNENNVNDDWGLIMEIVDQINQTNSEKEAIRIFIKRLNDRDPHVISHALTVLNACVSNCNRNFKLEVCSRVFIDELANFVLKKRHPKLSDKLASMIEGWYQEKEFKNDPAFNLIPTLYIDLKKNGVEFTAATNSQTNSNMMKSSSSSAKSYSDAKKEEEDLAKAIQLSLKEANANQSSRPKGSQQNQQSSLYSTLLSNINTSNNSSSFSSNSQQQKKRKVKALYDFEAVEENEISFKAGNFLFVTDESDQNWWKGIDTKGNEGLFPSNFVTSDLDTEIETFENKSDSNSKKVSFNDKVNIKELDNTNDIKLARQKVYIDEKKIDECIELLQNADPTGEIQPDTQELLELEDQCYMMGPLIDKQLQSIDYKHVVLEDLNLKMLEAFQIYNNLMKESISKSSIGYINTNPGIPSALSLNPPLGANQGALRGGNSIPYVAAPPLSSIDQSSLLLANQLNNIALSNNNFPGQSLPIYDANLTNQYTNVPPQPNGQQFNSNMNSQMYANNIPSSNNLTNAANVYPPTDNGVLTGGPGTGQNGMVNPNFYKA